MYIISTECTQTYFAPDTSIGAVVQQSKSCIKMTFFAGKHEGSESCVLWRRYYITYIYTCEVLVCVCDSLTAAGLGQLVT